MTMAEGLEIVYVTQDPPQNDDNTKVSHKFPVTFDNKTSY